MTNSIENRNSTTANENINNLFIGLENKDAHRNTVIKIMLQCGYTKERIQRALKEYPDGKIFIEEDNVTYYLDADSILRERIRQHQKSIHDYENDMAVARSEGRAEERSAIVERMRKNGFTEEQIKLVLGEDHNS